MRTCTRSPTVRARCGGPHSEFGILAEGTCCRERRRTFPEGWKAQSRVLGRAARSCRDDRKARSRYALLSGQEGSIALRDPARATRRSRSRQALSWGDKRSFRHTRPVFRIRNEAAREGPARSSQQSSVGQTRVSPAVRETDCAGSIATAQRTRAGSRRRRSPSR